MVWAPLTGKKIGRLPYMDLLFRPRKHIWFEPPLESIAFQLKDVIHAMEQETNTSLKELRVNGGLTANDFLMQFLADLLDKPVVNKGITDVSAWGAALISGLGSKLWKSTDDFSKPRSEMIRAFLPAENKNEVYQSYKHWLELIENKIAQATKIE